MARATTKKDLLESAEQQYSKLIDIIESLSEEEQEGNFNYDVSSEKGAHWTRDQNIRDVLIHLYEWHQLLLHWVEDNRNGIPRQFLLESYNWKSYGDMNIELWKKHQSTPYRKALELFRNSHQAVIQLIAEFSDEELFTRNYFSWTGGSTLGQYCVSVTSSHYDWALKKIKKYKKTLV